MMISDLNDSGQTFVVIQPDEDPCGSPQWPSWKKAATKSSAVTPPAKSTRSPTSTSINGIARDLTIWLAARHHPGRPTSQVTSL